MKLSTLLAGTAALVAFSLPATAQSVFDGAYIGAQIGMGQTSADGNYEPGTSGNSAFSFSDDENGLNGGIFAGYGKNIYQNFWLGGEFAYSRSDAEYKYDDGTVNGKIEQNETWEIALRPGYLIQPETMVYGRLGLVKTNFDAYASDGTTTISGDKTLDGVRFGLGVEHSLENNFSIRLDASYTNYEDYSISDSTTQEKVSIDGDEKLIRIGIAYRF